MRGLLVCIVASFSACASIMGESDENVWHQQGVYVAGDESVADEPDNLMAVAYAAQACGVPPAAARSAYGAGRLASFLWTFWGLYGGLDDAAAEIPARCVDSVEPSQNRGMCRAEP